MVVRVTIAIPRSQDSAQDLTQDLAHSSEVQIRIRSDEPVRFDWGSPLTDRYMPELSERADRD